MSPLSEIEVELSAAWVSDIIYIPTDEDWLYLAGHKYLFNKEIAGDAMGSCMTKNLVSQSLFKSCRNKASCNRSDSSLRQGKPIPFPLIAKITRLVSYET